MGKKSKKNKRSKSSYSQLNEKNASTVQSSGSNRRSKRLDKRNRTRQTSEAVFSDYQLRQSVEEGGSRTIVEVSADGNCLFRSLSDQLYSDYGNRHDEVRNGVCDYIERNEDEFAVFLVLDEDEEDEDAANFKEYCTGMREDGEWGGNVELVAAARLYRRNITVFSVAAAFTIEHGSEESSGPDMLLSYHDNDHYNSVRDDGRQPASKAKTSKAKTKSPDGDQEQQQREIEKNVIEVTDVDRPTSDTSQSRKSSRTPRCLKPNDPCRCGRGLRYKKCCLPADKRKERLRKWKEKNGINDAEDIDHLVEETLTTGKLKVLSI